MISVSRRPLQHPIEDMVKAHNRMAPGGLLWSESPIPRRFVPRVPMAGEDPPDVVVPIPPGSSLSRLSTNTWGVDSSQNVVPSPLHARIDPTTGFSTANTYRILLVVCGWHVQSFGVPFIASTTGGSALLPGETPSWTKVTEAGIPASGNARWAAWTSSPLVRTDVTRYNIDVPFVGDTPTAYTKAPMGHWFTGQWVNTGTGPLIPFNLSATTSVGTTYTVPDYPTGDHWYAPIQYLVGMPAGDVASPSGVMQMTFGPDENRLNTTSVQWRDNGTNTTYCRVSAVTAFGGSSGALGTTYTSRPSTFDPPTAGQFILLQGGWG